MTLYYEYTDEISITVFLKEDPVSPNYIWIELSRQLDAFLGQLDADFPDRSLITNFELQDEVKQRIIDFFSDATEVVYIPAGRSMMTLLSNQLSYI